jgi:hypothetical protein
MNLKKPLRPCPISDLLLIISSYPSLSYSSLLPSIPPCPYRSPSILYSSPILTLSIPYSSPIHLQFISNSSPTHLLYRESGTNPVRAEREVRVVRLYEVPSMPYSSPIHPPFPVHPIHLLIISISYSSPIHPSHPTGTSPRESRARGESDKGPSSAKGPFAIHSPLQCPMHCDDSALFAALHCLCSVGSLPIHCLFTAYSLPIHCLVTA